SGKYTGGDGNFSDLICQPFKQVRDAARHFLKKLDFVRGDRAAIIGFDTTVHIYHPEGSVNGSLPIMTDKTAAIRTLDYLVGIYINPNKRQRDCYTYNGGTDSTTSVNSNVNQYYGNAVQCADTNLGGGINAATSILTNPSWLRRES